MKIDWKINLNILMSIALILIVSLLFIFQFGQNINNQIIEYSLVKNFENKNLDDPFKNDLFLSDPYEQYIYGFHDTIKNIYHYEKDTYDCKYWSLIWASYFSQHGYNYDYIKTDNHVAVMLYDDSGYCIADGDILNCITIN